MLKVNRLSKQDRVAIDSYGMQVICGRYFSNLSNTKVSGPQPGRNNLYARCGTSIFAMAATQRVLTLELARATIFLQNTN